VVKDSYSSRNVLAGSILAILSVGKVVAGRLTAEEKRVNRMARKRIFEVRG
jgi:hypothetical protein